MWNKENTENRAFRKCRGYVNRDISLRRVFLRHKWSVIVASVFKFPRRSVGGKYLMRIQSETFVFKFFRREVDGAQEVEISLSMMLSEWKESLLKNTSY